MKVKKESEKVGLKLNIQKTNIRASSPITSWEIDGETVETVSDFFWGGSKITADGGCSHEIKDGNDNPVYETAKETLMYRTVFCCLVYRVIVTIFNFITS